MDDFTYQKVVFAANSIGKAINSCVGCAFKDKGCGGLRASRQIPECYVDLNGHREYFIFKPKR